MKKLKIELNCTCKECGHTGQVYLEGKEAERFHRAIMERWWSQIGLWLTLGTFTISAIAGFLFGWWRP